MEGEFDVSSISSKISIKEQLRCLTSLVQGPLTSSGFNTFCHLCKHCTSVRSLKDSATASTILTKRNHDLYG